MKKYFIITFILTSICIKSISQNATVIYQGSSLSNINNCPQCCNVFNQSGNNPTVGGLNHFPVSGGAIFDGTSIKMQTQVNLQSNINNGTAYAIGYTFKTGYNYTMTVDMGYSANPSTAFPKLTMSVRTSLPSPNDSDPTSCGPVTSSKYLSSIGNIIQVIYPSQTNVQTYSIPQFSVPSQRNFLVLTISDGGQSGTTALINKITITETLAISFNISPTNLQIPCGSTATQTFTINSSAGATGITGYTWNIGASPNGWLYNGNPAPTTISTNASTNTLQLTPDCGKALSSISATIAANGNSYNTTNSASTIISQPSYSISGNNSLCSGSTQYTINGLVCNSSIVWTPPSANFGSLSSLSTSPTTLMYGGTPGNFTLTANVTSCGVITPVTLPVHVGAYSSSAYTMSASGPGSTGSTQPLYWCPNQTYSFTISGGDASNYQWTIPPGWTLNYQSNYLCVLKAPTSSYPPTGQVEVTFTEPCGTQITKSFFVSYSSSSCSGTDPRFTFSPNPAPSYLYVAVASGYTSTTKIQRIQIINTSNYITVFDQSYGTPGTLSAYVTTSSFQSGTYTLRIYDGTTWAVYQFVR